MAHQRALQVTVQGNLPEEVLQKVSHAVQKAVRDEVAKIDLLRNYREEPLDRLSRDASKLPAPPPTPIPVRGPIMGIVLVPD